jgi:exosortase
MFGELLATFARRWASEPQYSHGFVIPIMAIGLGWMRRFKIPEGFARANWWGLSLLATGVLLHGIADYLYVEVADSAGLLCCVFGVVLTIWGGRLLRGIWPAILFLAFMFPLPFRFEQLLSGPLQLLGAREATYYIQACGIPAVAQGSTILMGDIQLGVAEACSGLRMLTVFIAISAAVMMVSRRTVWEKLLVLFSAIPIALICNIGRIVATAVAWTHVDEATANLIFHDLSGWLMMPSAMILLYLELRLIDWLFVEVPDPVAQIYGGSGAGKVPSASGMTS